MYTAIYLCFLTIVIGIYADGGLPSQQQPIQSLRQTINPFDPTFDSYVEDLLQKCHVPGMSIAIIDGGRITSKV